MIMYLKRIGLGIGILGIVTTPFVQGGVEPAMQQLIRTVATKNQEAICLKHGPLRYEKGKMCLNKTYARLAAVTCNITMPSKDLLKGTKCKIKIGFVLSAKDVANAKQDIIKSLCEDTDLDKPASLKATSPYTAFFCGYTRSKLKGDLKDIAEQGC